MLVCTSHLSPFSPTLPLSTRIISKECVCDLDVLQTRFDRSLDVVSISPSGQSLLTAQTRTEIPAL